MKQRQRNELSIWCIWFAKYVNKFWFILWRLEGDEMKQWRGLADEHANTPSERRRRKIRILITVYGRMLNWTGCIMISECVSWNLIAGCQEDAAEAHEAEPSLAFCQFLQSCIFQVYNCENTSSTVARTCFVMTVRPREVPFGRCAGACSLGPFPPRSRLISQTSFLVVGSCCSTLSMLHDYALSKICIGSHPKTWSYSSIQLLWCKCESQICSPKCKLVLFGDLMWDSRKYRSC